jgi:phosphoserine aminotransferase
MEKPTTKPSCPNFSSGPCAKHPGFELGTSLNDAPLGRSHRAEVGKQKIGLALSETRRILGLPEGYVVGMVPGSDTGAFEMAMWSLLGPRPVDVFSWESFGEGWLKDITGQLPLATEKGGAGIRPFHVGFGLLPDLSQANSDHDIVFTFNGTTSGVKVPNLDWISANRQGLTLCDATSGIFAMEMDWSKLDVITYSWQKVLGGEAAHGMLILSPRAIERLESYTPKWPMPKVFRLTNKGKVDMAVFQDSPINTVSMLCVEDYIDALKWAESVGGLAGLVARSQANLGVLEAFVEANSWISFLAADPATRSNTSVCLSISDLKADQLKKMQKILDKEGVAYDIGSYKDAPPGIRIWCGATVKKEDLEALMPWLSWAHEQAKL